MTIFYATATRYFPGRVVFGLLIFCVFAPAIAAQMRSFGARPVAWDEPQGLCEKPPALREPLDVVYPADAMRARQQGVAIIATYIEKNGEVTYGEIKHSSGFAALDSAALLAVQHGYFKACWRDGGPRGARLTVPVEFRLPGGQDWSVDKQPDALREDVHSLKAAKKAVEDKMEELQEEIRLLRMRQDSVRNAKNNQPSP